jgi:hypothetical protein
MGGPNGALARGRAMMERQLNFGPADGQVLLAAGCDPGFSPVTNTIDARIEGFLCGSYGQRWREAAQPRVERWTPAERKAIEAAQSVVGERRTIYDRAVDARFEVEHLYYNPDPRTTPQQLVQLARRHRDAIEAQRVATEDLEKAVALLVTLKMESQNRRRWEATVK